MSIKEEGIFGSALDKLPPYQTKQKVYRVIDDGECVLTTLSAEKALLLLMDLIEKHDVTACWADVEELK